MVDYVECIDWVATLTITPKPGAGGSNPSTPANLELKVDKGFKGFSELVGNPFLGKNQEFAPKNGKICT